MLQWEENHPRQWQLMAVGCTTREGLHSPNIAHGTVLKVYFDQPTVTSGSVAAL